MSIAKFDTFLNEQSGSIYTVDDVIEAFNAIEGDIHDWYSIDGSKVEFNLEWDFDGAGDVTIEGKVDSFTVDFDKYGFLRTLKLNLKANPENKGPKFTLDEIDRAIFIVYDNDVFEDNIDISPSDVPANLNVSRGSKGSLVVEGSFDDESFDITDYDVDTDSISDSIREELLKGVARRIDYA